MPRAIDKSKLEPGPDQVQTLDISKPPTIEIPYEPFPKCIYLHPKDKTKEHLSKIVYHQGELDSHLEIGWKTNPHIPVAPVEEASAKYAEYETVQPAPSVDSEAEDEPENKPLEAMTKAELLAVAKFRGIEVDPTSTKAVILAAVSGPDQE